MSDDISFTDRLFPFHFTWTDFHEIEQAVLLKALDVLVKKGEAQTLHATNAEEMGVKFFGTGWNKCSVILQMQAGLLLLLLSLFILVHGYL